MLSTKVESKRSKSSSGGRVFSLFEDGM